MFSPFEIRELILYTFTLNLNCYIPTKSFMKGVRNMKKLQWYVILGIVFAIIVAVFAVVNVDKVDVNYVFGTAHWPLILVILGSVAMGGVIVGSVMAVRIVTLTKQLKELKKEHPSFNESAEDDSYIQPK